MSLTTEWEVKNIIRYAKLLALIEEKSIELSMLKDELINLSTCMSNEDINEAQKLAVEQAQEYR